MSIDFRARETLELTSFNNKLRFRKVNDLPTFTVYWYNFIVRKWQECVERKERIKRAVP